MKKRMECLLVLFIFTACAGFVQGVTVENPGFEYDSAGDPVPPDEWLNDETPIGWTWNEQVERGIGLDGTNHFYWQGDGSYLSQLTNETITSAGLSFTLTVDVRDDWQCYPRIMLYYAADEEGAWTELGATAGSGADGVWETIELTITTTAGSVGNRLGIALSQADDTGYGHFDNVRLVNNAVILVNPDPETETELIRLDEPLIWEVAPQIQTIDLYFGTENDPNLTEDPLGRGYKKLSNEPNETTTYYPTMDFNTTYYWKVVGYEPNTLLPGATDRVPIASDVASFTTTGPAPVISAMTPYGQSVPADVGEDPTITANGANLGGSTIIVWKKDGVELTDGIKYGGLGTTTLTINDMILDDEGIYTCEASNGDGDDSANAVVVTERLMSWWKLDGNLDDSVQEIVADAPEFDGVVDPNTVFTTDNSGIDNGNSVILEITDPNCPFIQIDGTEEWFNFYEDELTVSAWIRTSYVSSSAWPAVVSKQPVEDSGYDLCLDGESETLIDIHQTRLNSNGPVVADGQWHMLTLTYDGSVQRIYVDGVLVVTSSATAVNAVVNTAPVVFGAWDLESLDADFEGNIDNVKIYSYALTSTEVGEEYVATNPNVDYVCNYELPVLDFDTDGNCRVDLADFADFAGNWLACNRIPDTACSN